MKSITLKDIDYDNRLVILDSNDGETFKVSFEFFEDINRYLSGEWEFIKKLEDT